MYRVRLRVWVQRNLFTSTPDVDVNTLPREFVAFARLQDADHDESKPKSQCVYAKLDQRATIHCPMDKCIDHWRDDESKWPKPMKSADECMIK